MPEILDNFRGRSIQKVERMHDYVQIYFDDESVLNIFNTFSVGSSEFGDLIGCEVVGTNIDETATSFLLSNGAAIRVGMTDADFHGPEAMEYIPIAGPAIVWP